MLANLANVDAELCERVAANLGLDGAGRVARRRRRVVAGAVDQVPAAPGPIDGRVVGVLAGDGVDAAGVDALRDGARGRRRQPVRHRPPRRHHRRLGRQAGAGRPQALFTTQSVEYDALVVAGGPGGAVDGRRRRARQPPRSRPSATTRSSPRGATASRPSGAGRHPRSTPPAWSWPRRADAAFGARVVEAIGWHRFWERAAVPV